MQRLGLEPEGRKYIPHVTLARLRDSSSWQVADYFVGARPFRSAAFEVSRFVLFSSRSSVGGGPYVVEAAYPLASMQGDRVGRGYSFSGSAAPSHAQHARLQVQHGGREAVAVGSINSRISESGVARQDSTSPTTLPKSKVSSASNLRASCCMRRFSAKQAMCSRR